MRLTIVAALLSGLALGASAQEATIVLPEGNFGNYDPTLSAKDAVLANWEMAASGIRAGEVLGGRVVDLADDGASFNALAHQAAFAQKTMLSRYNAAAWLFHQNPQAEAMSDETLRAFVASTALTCTSDDCSAASAEIRDAFAQATMELERATEAARAEIIARQGTVDAVLMSEQFAMLANYLESGAWAENLTLTEFGMDVAVVSDRIVGTVSLWRNVEPYVGITDKELDIAINDATRNLLRTLRRDTRGLERLEPGSPVMRDLKAAADALATEYRRASVLFTS